jgi:hypothetical protein
MQDDRFLLFNLLLGVPSLPGTVAGRGDEDEDDAGSVSSQSSVASDVAGPSTSKKKKRQFKQVLICRVYITMPLVPTYLLQASF